MAGSSLSILLFTDIFGGADYYIAQEIRRAIVFFLAGTLVATPVVAVTIGPIWFILHKQRRNGPSEAFLAGAGCGLFMNLFILHGRTIIHSASGSTSSLNVISKGVTYIKDGQYTSIGWLDLLRETALISLTAGASALIIWWIVYERMPLQRD